MQFSQGRIAVALGHNAISLWRWKENEVLNTVHCEDKCILYPFKIKSYYYFNTA